MSKITKSRLAAACAAAALFTTGAAQAEMNELQLEVITGNHTDVYTINHMMPFFGTTLPEASGGKVSAHTVPYTELGLSGFELMNLLKLGTNDISWGVPGYVAGDSPILEGLEIPGATGDMATIFKVQDAYRPIFDRELEKHFNAKILTWVPQPQLKAFCKLPEDQLKNFSLASMKGKNVRVHSTAFADYAESMGAVPVTMPFADVIPALDRGTVDCALTSPSAAYGYKIGQVANAVVDLGIGYSTQFYAVNLDTWNGLNDETKAMLTEKFAAVEQAMRDYTPGVETEMANCLAEGPCTAGEVQHMVHISLSEADIAELHKGVEGVVLPRWAARAGAEAAAEWSAVEGQLIGMTAKAN